MPGVVKPDPLVLLRDKVEATRAINDVIGVVFATDQVALMFGVRPATVYRWIKAGKLPAYRLGPRGDFRVKAEDLRDFLVAYVPNKHGSYR